MLASFLLRFAYFWVHLDVSWSERTRDVHGKGLNYIVTRHTFQAVVCQSVGSFVWLACGLQCLCRAWLNSTYLHFPITSISSLGFSPWHFRHWQSFINAPPPLAFHALISASDRRNVKHKRQYHLGLWEWFSSGSQKMDKKTSEPIVFCYSTPFKCSSLPFWIWWRLVRLMAERCRKCPCCSPVITDLFICALWLNKCHTVGHNVILLYSY